MKSSTVTLPADLVEEIREFLEDYSDVVDGQDGPRPNKAMALLSRIEEEARSHPEARRSLTDEEIMNAAITAADALDATRVSEMRAGGWHPTTIFDGDTGLIRFGRLIESALSPTHRTQS